MRNIKAGKEKTHPRWSKAQPLKGKTMRRIFCKEASEYIYSYKAHIGANESSGVIRKGSFTASQIHDFQEFEKLFCRDEVAQVRIELS